MVAPVVRQTWTVTAVWANMIGQGMILSYTSTLLPALQDPASSIRPDLYTASWIASSSGLACMPGLFMSAFFMDVCGRKKAQLLLNLPGIIGWFIIYFAKNVPDLILGRVLGGITAGAATTLGAIVIGEYAHPKYRGVFLNLKTASVCLGGMLVHFLDHFLTWRTIALLGVIPYTISLLIIFTWPESPAWLASKGEFDKSKKTFFWLREKSDASYKEIDELIKAQTEKLTKPKVEMHIMDKTRIFFKNVTRRDFLCPVIIVIVSTILLEASGRHIFPAYALQIIRELTGDESQSFYYILGIDLIVTASAISSSILVKIMKRRRLLFSTGFLAVAVLMIACTYLTLVYSNKFSNTRPWIALVIFVLFFILANLGCTPIPSVLLGEIFPLAHRGVGSAVAGIFMSLQLMLVLQITPYLLVHLKVHGTFFVYGLIMALTLLILCIILPETRDKTLQEIEDYFNYGRYRDGMKDVEVEEVKEKR